MKKCVYGVVTILIMAFCLNLSGMQVEASGPRDGEVVDGSLLTSDLEATDKFENVLRGTYLSMGMSLIKSYGNGADLHRGRDILL